MSKKVRQTIAKPAFKVFLSHRYKSSEVNQYFFELLASHGDLQFEVDIGTKATNVTRLERLVRDSDAFVGIYPFPSEDDARPDFETALRASRYFRLELDLAARSRRPAIVFVDTRYGTAMTVPKTICECRYDHREVFAASRRGQGLDDIVRTFCDEVATLMWLEAARRYHNSTVDRVGILLPDGRSAPSGYSRAQVSRLQDLLRARSLTPVTMGWKSHVDGAFLSELTSLDWAIVDIGEDMCSGGLPAFLHGHFVPQMRMLRLSPREDQTQSPLETTLLTTFDVGYPKDIVRWRDGRSLEREFLQRLTTLYEPHTYIKSPEEARKYFTSAALRNEPVFLSYSGEDRDFAANFADALRSRFQQVFDYRDQGQSIVPGRRWMEEVFDTLAASAIGVPLLSSSYFKSGNCKHEAQEMIARADSGKLRVIPFKIDSQLHGLPSWIGSVQYHPGWGKTPEELVEDLIRFYDAPEGKKPWKQA